MPSILLLIVMSVFLIIEGKRQDVRSTESVQQSLIDVTDRYAMEFRHELNVLASVQAPALSYLRKDVVSMEENKEPDLEGLKAIFESTYDSCKVDQIILCDLDGNGYDVDTNAINIQEEEYFDVIKNQVGTGYSYAQVIPGKEEPGIAISTPVIISGQKRILLYYYALPRFETLLNRNQYGGTCIYAVMDRESNILYGVGESELVQGNNFVDDYYDQKNRDLWKLSNRIASGANACVELPQQSGEAYVVTSSPVKLGNLHVIMGVTKSTFDRLVAAETALNDRLINGVSTIVVLYLAAMIVFTFFQRKKTHKASQELEEKADTDQLTGLSNKSATERKIKEYMTETPKAPGMLILFDVDNFKKINDTMGHSFGDEVLQALGQQISTNFRVTDVVGRIGGDEFMVFLKNINGEEIVQREAAKINFFFRNFTVGSYVKYSPTASIGVAMFPKDGDNFEKLYKAADSALYQSKKNGKNQLTFYSDTEVAERLEKK